MAFKKTLTTDAEDTEKKEQESDSRVIDIHFRVPARGSGNPSPLGGGNWTFLSLPGGAG
jgi:hypothetical protein